MFEMLAQLLGVFYSFTKSYGAAIILLTVAVRLVLFPLTAKQMRSMQAMGRLQPELKRLQAEHKDDRLKLQEEMTALYRREKVSPVGGCAPMVLQIPVFIGLFNVIRGLSRSRRLAGFQIQVPAPQYLKSTSAMYRSIVNSGGQLKSFGFNLAQSARDVTGTVGQRFPYVFLIVFYVATAYFQQSLANKKNTTPPTGQAAQVQQMMKVFPLFLGFFYYNMPAGLVLYFVASNVWTIAQQEILSRTMPATAAAPDAEAAPTPVAASPLQKAVAAKGKLERAKADLEPAKADRPTPPKDRSATSTPRPGSGKITKADQGRNNQKPIQKGTNKGRGRAR